MKLKSFDPLQKRLQNQSGGKILDVATGHGQFLRILTEYFAGFDGAVGIDTSENNIEIARRECGNGFDFKVMNAEKIDYPDGYFDTVSIRHSLHHLANVDSALAEMSRVVKPEGRFIICEVFQSPDTDYENSQRHIHHWWAAVDRAQGKSHNETFTKSEILRFVDNLNLDNIDIFDFTEHYEENENSEILESMLNRCKSIISELKEGGEFDDLIISGEKLISRFSELGLVYESYLCIIGRKYQK